MAGRADLEDCGPLNSIKTYQLHRRRKPLGFAAKQWSGNWRLLTIDLQSWLQHPKNTQLRPQAFHNVWSVSFLLDHRLEALFFLPGITSSCQHSCSKPLHYRIIQYFTDAMYSTTILRLELLACYDNQWAGEKQRKLSLISLHQHNEHSFCIPRMAWAILDFVQHCKQDVRVLSMKRHKWPCSKTGLPVSLHVFYAEMAQCDKFV